MIGWGTRIRT